MGVGELPRVAGGGAMTRVRKDATGQVIVEGDAVMLRVRYNGKRPAWVVGHLSEGYTIEDAGRELKVVMARLRAGEFQLPDTLNNELRAMLDSTEEEDPYVIAERALAELQEDLIRAEMVNLLAQRVKELVRQQRGTVPGQGGYRQDPLRWRVKPNEEWKFLGDCTREEVLMLADQYRSRAAQMVAHQTAMLRLAKEMQHEGAVRVRDVKRLQQIVMTKQALEA